jgi:PKHD-type hydroxylase
MQLDRAQVRQKGALVIFPTYWLHKVHPVTRGTRHVVVGWMHGPSYR